MIAPSSAVPLVNLLRAELAGYGGMLALFEQQQALVLRREAGLFADTIGSVEELAAEVARDRSLREAWVARFATEHGQPASSTLRQLLPLFPFDQRPMLLALADEINRLIQCVRRRARQNQSILARAVELHRETIALLAPVRPPRTYAPTGRMSGLVTSAIGLQAAG